jgi:ubiquinone biosynthesis protein COQ9
MHDLGWDHSLGMVPPVHCMLHRGDPNAGLALALARSSHTIVLYTTDKIKQVFYIYWNRCILYSVYRTIKSGNCEGGNW